MTARAPASRAAPIAVKSQEGTRTTRSASPAGKLRATSMISVREYLPCCMSRHTQSNPSRASRAAIPVLASSHHTPLLAPPNPPRTRSSAVTRPILDRRCQRMLSAISFSGREQLRAMCQRGTHPPMLGTQLNLCCVDLMPRCHAERTDPPLREQPIKLPRASMGLESTIAQIREQRRHSLDRVGLVGTDDSGRSALNPAGDVLIRRESTVADHSPFSVGHPAGARVERNTGQRQPAVTHRTDDKIGGKSLVAADTSHITRGIDHGALDLHGGHSITAHDHCRPGPKAEADALRSTPQRSRRPILKYAHVA